MSILKLKPGCKDYLWGGRRLVEEYGKKYDGDVVCDGCRGGRFSVLRL